MKTKSLKTPKLWIIIAAAVLVVAAAAVVLVLMLGGKEPVEPPAELITDLYWNLDRDQYVAAADGTTPANRTPEADGMYKIRFLKDGQVVEYKAENRRVVGEIDGQYIWGLVTDERGVITELIPLERLAYEKYAWQYYVKETDEKQAFTYSSMDYEGLESIIEFKETTQVYDMTHASGEPGAATKLQPEDRIMALKNLQGDVAYVFVYQREGLNASRTAFCQYCQQEVTWKNWYKEGKLPTETGHYFLQQDMVLTGQQSIKVDQEICLDLNGFTVTGKEDSRIYSLHAMGARLAISDSSEGKTGKLVASGANSAQGCCVWVRYGRFDLYDATLDGSGATSNVNGAVVAVPAKSEFYMHSGTIIGGTAKYAIKAGTSTPVNGMGGAVNVAGTMTMDGGEIRDGKAVCYKEKGILRQGYGGNVLVMGGTFTMNGGSILCGRAEGGGGNVYITSKGSFTMNGGTIAGGAVSGKGKNGGNVSVGSECNFTMTGGTISGGVCRNYAGNVYVGGTMTMSGGRITGGKILDYETGEKKEDHNAKNLFLVNGTLSMSGGRIDGSVNVTDSAKGDGKKPVLNLSGTPIISGAPEGNSNLYLNAGNDGYTLNIGTLRKGAVIGVTASGVISTKTSEANKEFIIPDTPGAEVNMLDGCLFLGKLHCLCGSTDGNHIGDCDGKILGWSAWNSDKSLPVSDGYYYLTQDVNCGQASVAKDAHVRLDLNGKTVTGKENSRIYATFNENSHLTITDSSAEKTGKLVAIGANNAQGGCVWVRYGSFHLYGATLDGSGTTSNVNGAVVSVPAKSEFVMHSGTIIGGTATYALKTEKPEGSEQEKTTPINGMGGAVSVAGTFTMEGGEIRDGKAACYKTDEGALFQGYGGNVLVVGGKFTMNGGKISGGQAEGGGGNVYLTTKGSFTMNGGLITGGDVTGKGKNGGNVSVGSDCDFTMTGGTISGGVCRNYAGNVHVNGTMTMSGGLITGGTILDYTTGAKKETHSARNLFLINGTMKMSGGCIEGHILAQSTTEKGASLTLAGSARITGGTENKNLSLTATAPGVIPVLEIEGVLNDDALICVDASGIFTGETVEANKDKFVLKNGTNVTFLDQKLAAGLQKACLCGSTDGQHAEGCDGTGLYWKPWAKTNSLPTQSGNYYLLQDVTLTGSQKLEEADVYLDLNGKTVTCAADSATRVYWLTEDSSKLTITDSSTEKSGKIVRSGNAGGAQGGILWCQKGTVNLYGGTLDASGLTCTFGAPVDISGKLNVYGGTLIGGTGANGGAIRVASTKATLTMTGGSIVGGTAFNGGAIYNVGTMNLNGGTITGGSAVKNGTDTATGNGGVIYNTGTITIKGTVISGGTAGTQGGTIYNQGTITMEDGQILRGDAPASIALIKQMTNADASITVNGGTIDGGTPTGAQYGAITATSGSVNITGGTVKTNGQTTTYLYGAQCAVSGGTISSGSENAVSINVNGASGRDGSIVTISGGTLTGKVTFGGTSLSTVNVTGGELPLITIANANGNLNLSGGTVGAVTFTNGTVTLSGAPVINGAGIQIASGKMLTLGELTDQTNVNLAETSGLFASTDKGEYAAYFHPAAGGTVLFVENEGLYLVEKYGCELCGGTYENCAAEHQDANQVIWTAWTDSSSLPTASGNYYLQNDVTVTATTTLASADVRLDLNGKTVSCTANGSTRIYRLSAASSKLTILDTSAEKTGKLVRTGSAGGAQGAVIWCQNGTVNLYGGTLDASGLTCTFGAPVDVSGKLYMYGGTIIGGTGAKGGAIRLATTTSVMNMSGGAIYGGKATTNGDNIFINGMLTVTGGKIGGGVHNETGSDTKLVVSGTDRISKQFVEEINAALPADAQPYYVPAYDISGAYSIGS